MSTSFTTSALTEKVRYILGTIIGCDQTRGSVTYDSCSLDGPPAPCTVTGKVTSNGKNLAGALVTLGSLSGMTGADGVYTIGDAPRSGRISYIRAACDGCTHGSGCRPRTLGWSTA